MSNNSFQASLLISKYTFQKDSIKEIENNIWVKNLWPLIYILSDAKLEEAYVGESTSALKRMSNHLTKSEKAKLKTLHLITCDKFNKSATLDIEANLIKYISGDGKFKLQNSNLGLTSHSYYQKEKYFDIFKLIWAELAKEKIAKNALRKIDNSNLFKYSPYKSLSKDQHEAVIRFMESFLVKNSNTVFVEGSAGTGKTILAIYLMKLLKSEPEDFEIENIDATTIREIQLLNLLKKKYPNPEIALVVPMASLRETLQKVFKTIKGLNARMVIGPSEVVKKKYDILIVDEAHRLKRRVAIMGYGSFDNANKILRLKKEATELDWILKQSKNQLFFYDEGQSIKPADVRKADFNSLKKQKRSPVIPLTSQLRVKGGFDYINYVHNLFECTLSEKAWFEHKEYEFLIFDSLKELKNKLEIKEEEYGLSRLVAGFSWKWNSKSRKKKEAKVRKEDNAIFDIELEGLSFQWNSTTKDWVNSNDAFKEIGCIHTTQGNDLNYAGIILGKEIGYDPETKKISIRKEHYHDSKGKESIEDPEELKEYILNIYRTLLFRGIRGTYVYVYDENLRAYFKKHIPSFKEEQELQVLPSFRILPSNEVQPYVNSVPLYNIYAAASGFSELQTSTDFEWIELPESEKINEDYFACKVVGNSMNRQIPNGSLCLFKKDPGGSREGKIVLVEHYKIQDPDFGSGFTVKVYHSEKQVEVEQWSHTSIVLKPSSNVPFPEIVLSQDEASRLNVIGVFVKVLG